MTRVSRPDRPRRTAPVRVAAPPEVVVTLQVHGTSDGLRPMHEGAMLRDGKVFARTPMVQTTTLALEAAIEICIAARWTLVFLGAKRVVRGARVQPSIGAAT